MHAAPHFLQKVIFMSLYEKVDQEIKRAMRDKKPEILSVLRFLKSALKYVAIEKKVERLSDLEVLQIIQKQIKQRKESIDQFSKGERDELVKKESFEISVLERYLPAQLSDDVLSSRIQEIIMEAGVTSKKDFGKAMKLIQEKLSGQAEAKRISEILNNKLS